jgi:hypothetical protein
MSGILPKEYLFELLELLQEHERVKFVNFKGMQFALPPEVATREQLQGFYDQEFKLWRAAEAKNKSQSLSVMLAHDCDSGPKETVLLSQFEAALRIPATTAIFFKTIKGNEVVDYAIDYATLVTLQAHGIEFAYHANAWDCCSHIFQELPETFNDHVTGLKRLGFDIRCFSPHGAKASACGRTNSSFFYPDFWQQPLIWTHNGFSPGGIKYSDGSLYRKLENADPDVDLRSFFLKRISSGIRLRLFIHPQYYFAENDAKARAIAHNSPWVLQYWQLWYEGRSKEFWTPLRVALDRVGDES